MNWNRGLSHTAMNLMNLKRSFVPPGNLQKDVKSGVDIELTNSKKMSKPGNQVKSRTIEKAINVKLFHLFIPKLPYKVYNHSIYTA